MRPGRRKLGVGMRDDARDYGGGGGEKGGHLKNV
jgi:hypothetical protein